jgi:hypothetical protein
MIIEKALLENAEEILELQKLAYLSEAETYNDYSIPPLTQTIDQIRADFENSGFCPWIYGKRYMLYRKTHCSSGFSETRYWDSADERNRGAF